MMPSLTETIHESSKNTIKSVQVVYFKYQTNIELVGIKN